eukprot:IDg20015t1
MASGKSNGDTAAVVKAELGGYMLACRIDSGADRDVISETIVSYLVDKGLFLPTQLLSRPEQLKAIDDHLMQSEGTAKISPLIQTMAGSCLLRNVKVNLIVDKDTYVLPGNACAGEIVLRKPFLIASGLNVKDFLADNIERLAAVDYVSLQCEDQPAKVGKSEFSLLSHEIGTGDPTPKGHNPCSFMSS